MFQILLKSAQEQTFLTHGSSIGRFVSHCNRAVAMENQHALLEDTAAKRNACA